MPENNNVVPKSTSDSHADGKGLVAIIVVLVLLVLGGAAAYLLMRWYFARARGKGTAVGEQGSTGLETLPIAREKVHPLGIWDHNEKKRERDIRADVEGGLGRRRSATGRAGDQVHTRL
ncbi:hypothetical protein F5Y09DRAFT_316359 [Xylaria sp. FL1042]|nr:hypothetical protein F5Y09DRAFT_316359 [Xylaria sp. FL1042]